MKSIRPNYSLDPEFEGYLYLYESDEIEEELKFEELINSKQRKALDEDFNNSKKDRALQFIKYAEEKFKLEKQNQSQKQKPGIKGKDKPNATPMDQTKISMKIEKKIITEKKVVSKKFKSNETDQLKRRRRGDKRYSLNMYNDLQEVEAKIAFFRKEMFEKHFTTFGYKVKKLLKLQYEELIVQRSKFRERMNKRLDPMMKASAKKAPVKSKGFGPWETLWVNKKEDFQKESPYKDFPSYRIRQIIVKGGDDLRQEIIAQQLLRKLKMIFMNEGTSLKLQTYEIVVINSSSGVIGRPTLIQNSSRTRSQWTA